MSVVRGICLSASQKEEFDAVATMIHQVSPATEIIDFYDVLKEISLLDKCDFIFTVGGDGSVAWLIRTFFDTYLSLDALKPLVPVIRPSSVGYLKQLSYEKEKFIDGFKKILNNNFTVNDRIILHTIINDKPYVAVNEIYLSVAPHIGTFNLSLGHSNVEYSPMTTTMADGVMVVTPIGSTGWNLSHNGLINLDEQSLQVVFVGGIHSSANFIIPTKPLQLSVELKNSSIVAETVESYVQSRKIMGYAIDPRPRDTLSVLFNTRVIIDGKIIAFGETSLEIYSTYSVPFIQLSEESSLDKARKLTRQPDVK